MMNVQGSGDASQTAGDDSDTAAGATPADPHRAKGKEGSCVTEAAKEERGEEADTPVPEQEQPATEEEQQVAATHPSEALEQKSHFEVNGSYRFSQRRSPESQRRVVVVLHLTYTSSRTGLWFPPLLFHAAQQ